MILMKKIIDITELNRHTTRMKIRGSVVSLSFIFPHPPEDERKKYIDYTDINVTLLWSSSR